MAPGRLGARMAATGGCVCVFVCWDRRWQVAEEVRSQDGVERRNQGPGLAWVLGAGCSEWWCTGAVRTQLGRECGEGFFAWLACRRGGR